ncbi:glycosyltransferase family 61 protein [Hymenobacter algoricola]|uniref:Glycosyltransferase 61 catalytic domain-containing protein n=1 Tax=Hymenobacter algoricola TaxID=486267 RepID=A0ABP7MN87_9BACT
MYNVITRARRRAGRLLREIVPFQQHYKPVGVAEHSESLRAHPASRAQFHPIVPAYTSHLAVPDDFYARASDYGGLYGKPQRQEQVPPSFVLTLEDGRLYADNLDSVAIITADNQLVGDVSFQFTSAQWNLCRAADNSIFRQRYFLTPVEVPGTVCSLLSGGGAATGNYYHWLIDSLPRLHLVREAGLLSQIDYFLVYDKTKRFVLDTLAPLGIRPEQLLDVRTHAHLRARRLVVPSAVRGTQTHTPGWACDFLRDALLPSPLPARQFGPYVYISRRDAPGRHVRNEAALEALLQDYGFETHILTPYSQAEKVALFAHARVVISAVGAGLANIVFCPAGAQLIELLPERFMVPDYLELAARLGVRHRYLVCSDPHLSSSRGKAQFDHVTVDLAELRRQVEKALDRQPTPA